MKRPEFLKQKVMLKVIYALAPVAAVSVYFFGWRVLAVVLFSNIIAFLTEWYMASKRNGKVTYACFVTATIYGLSLPPTVPFWIAGVGALIAIFFGKEVFGGFGRNVFNPAVVGRAFVYVSFPVEMTSRFVPAFQEFPAGLGRWSILDGGSLPQFISGAGLKLADAVTAATPMWAGRDFNFVTGWLPLFTGSIGEVFTFESKGKVLAAGSAGEVCAAVIILSGLYLIYTKTAQWRLVLSTIIGAAALNIILKYLAGLDAVPHLHFTLLSGAMLYVAVFMVTDPISAPKLKGSQWIYGIVIGAGIVFFRYKSIFAGGAAFAILFGNMAAPSLDLWIKRYKESRKKKEAANE